jgi:hypothetical protein
MGHWINLDIKTAKKVSDKKDVWNKSYNIKSVCRLRHYYKMRCSACIYFEQCELLRFSDFIPCSFNADPDYPIDSHLS